MAIKYSIGDLIKGEYRIYGIQQGGMGIVYLTKHTFNETSWALKTFKDFEDILNEEARSELIAEFNRLMNFTYHPNIVMCGFLDMIDKVPFIGMELIEGNRLTPHRGNSLRDWIASRDPLISLSNNLKHAVDICRGLLHLKKNYPDFVHQDLKPSNILIDQFDNAKIVDFGLSSILKNTTGFGGTPLYMSPEQWNHEVIDERTDVYAIGHILFEALDGNHHFFTKNKPFSIKNLKAYHLSSSIKVDLGKSSKFQQRIQKLLERTQEFKAFKVLYDQIDAKTLETFKTKTSELIKRCCSIDKNDRPTLQELFDELQNLYEIVSFKFEKNDLSRAEDVFEKEYNSALTLTNRGAAEDFQGNYDLAEELYNEAIKTDPNYFRAWINLAVLKSLTGRMKEALVDGKRAVELNKSQDRITYYLYAGILENNGDLNGALKYYSLSVKNSITDSQPYVYRSQLYIKLKRYEEAIIDLKSAIKLEPKLTNNYLELAKVYRDLNDPKSELLLYLDGVKEVPNFHTFHAYIADCFRDFGDYLQALKAANKALELKPNDLFALKARLTIYEKLEKYELMLADANTIIHIWPASEDAYYNQGTALAALGRDREAIQSYQNHMKLNPNDDGALLNLANSYARVEDNQRAEQTYKECLQLDPESLQYHVAFIGFLVKIKDLKTYKSFSLETRNRFGHQYQVKNWLDSLDSKFLK